MYININDISLYYEKYGNKKKQIIILPGWGETRKTFTPMINFLKQEATVYIIDYPGFGNTIFPHRDFTIYDYTNLILDFMNILGIHNPIIIGHSFGGRIAITLTGYFHHKIDKLILIGSAGIKPKKTLYQKLRQTIYKMLKKIVNILPKKYRKNFQNYLISKFASQDFQDLNPFMRKTFIQVINEDLKDYLSQIKVPTLLIWGEDDDSTPLEDGKIMAKMIEDSGLVVLEKCGHFCYLQQPYYVNQIIDSFINEKE